MTLSRRPLTLFGAALSLALFLPHPAHAAGRTDGPEASEVGQGGYDAPGAGTLSLALNWGGAVPDHGPLSGSEGAPLYIGGTLSFWGSDWLTFDLSGLYDLAGRTTDLLVGPKFRAGASPLAGVLGLKAGAMITPDGLRFGLSPEIGVDLVLRRALLLGLSWNIDLPLGTSGHTHRIGMNVGWRF